jgi:hypothetical protein
MERFSSTRKIVSKIFFKQLGLLVTEATTGVVCAYGADSKPVPSASFSLPGRGGSVTRRTG